MVQDRAAQSAFVNAIDSAHPVPCDLRGESPRTLCFRAGPGLYQLSVVLDGADFAWESLYENLHMFGNKGQRTGPWDFKLGPNTPLLPAYRVSLDGRYIGLWLMERPSIADLERRVFRGRTAFFVAADGDHEVVFEPYLPARVTWRTVCLEVDPEDCLAPLPTGLRSAPGNVPVARWADPAFWTEQQRRLQTTHRAYADPLRLVFAWAAAHGPEEDNRRLPQLDVPLLVAAWRLANDAGALDRALQAIDMAVAMEHWGNPHPDGYGHDGDMGAALMLRAMAWGVHMLGEQLGEQRRHNLLQKLALQGERFFHLALLNRDYWGGALLQDHGWRSAFSFGTAALHLHGILPEAERWLMYALPRVQRSLNAMPTDGVVPLSSHHDPWLYLFDPAQYRDTLLALGGPDIYDSAPFRPVVRYLALTSSPRDHRGAPAPGPAARLFGPSLFLNQMAVKYTDAQAAWLSRQMLECAAWPTLRQTLLNPEVHHARANHIVAHGLLWGGLSHDPQQTADPHQAETTAPPTRGLLHFEDSAVVLFDDRESGASFSLHCGPRNGYHAYRNARNSHDRLGWAPVAGHFNLAIDGVPLLLAAPPGYRLNTFLGNVLLVDGQGQKDDIGYPMSIPAWRDHGAEILTVRWDEATQRGFVRLDLQPAYPTELGVIHYWRDVLFTAERRIVLRDQLALLKPRTLSWLFHARDASGLAREKGLRYRLGTAPCLFIEPGDIGPPLGAAEKQTDVVYSYGPLKPTFSHVRYDTAEPVAAATADFVIHW